MGKVFEDALRELTRPHSLPVIPRGARRERSPYLEALGAKRGGSADMHVARGV